jgi:hypothetical protein
MASASSSSVQRARPSGGFAQAVATSKASSLPVSLRSAPGRGSSLSARSTAHVLPYKRRGCELHELHDGYDDANETILIYWLFVADYKDPVVFDDLDEVEIDLKSRPVVKELRAASSVGFLLTFLVVPDILGHLTQHVLEFFRLHIGRRITLGRITRFDDHEHVVCLRKQDICLPALLFQPSSYFVHLLPFVQL